MDVFILLLNGDKMIFEPPFIANNSTTPSTLDNSMGIVG